MKMSFLTIVSVLTVSCACGGGNLERNGGKDARDRKDSMEESASAEGEAEEKSSDYTKVKEDELATPPSDLSENVDGDERPSDHIVEKGKSDSSNANLFGAEDPSIPFLSSFSFPIKRNSDGQIVGLYQARSIFANSSLFSLQPIDKAGGPTRIFRINNAGTGIQSLGASVIGDAKQCLSLSNTVDGSDVQLLPFCSEKNRFFISVDRDGKAKKTKATTSGSYWSPLQPNAWSGSKFFFGGYKRDLDKHRSAFGGYGDVEITKIATDGSVLGTLPIEAPFGEKACAAQSLVAVKSNIMVALACDIPQVTASGGVSHKQNYYILTMEESGNVLKIERVAEDPKFYSQILLPAADRSVHIYARKSKAADGSLETGIVVRSSSGAKVLNTALTSSARLLAFHEVNTVKAGKNTVTLLKATLDCSVVKAPCSEHMLLEFSPEGRVLRQVKVDSDYISKISGNSLGDLVVLSGRYKATAATGGLGIKQFSDISVRIVAKDGTLSAPIWSNEVTADTNSMVSQLLVMPHLKGWSVVYPKVSGDTTEIKFEIVK